MAVEMSPQLREFIAAGRLHRRAIAEVVADTAGRLAPGTRVLDAGAGNAPYRELFGHCSYVAQDWEHSPHSGARQAEVIGDLHDLPVDAGSFDAVLCTEVLEHVARPAEAIAEIARVLRPGGELVATVPFVMELHEEPHDFYRYTPHALAELLDRAGFDQITVRPLGGFFSTLGHVLFHAGNATFPRQGDPSRATRFMAWVGRVLSRGLDRLAPRLDRLDQRGALPIGWVLTARTAPAGER